MKPNKCSGEIMGWRRGFFGENLKRELVIQYICIFTFFLIALTKPVISIERFDLWRQSRCFLDSGFWDVMIIINWPLVTSQSFSDPCESCRPVSWPRGLVIRKVRNSWLSSLWRERGLLTTLQKSSSVCPQGGSRVWLIQTSVREQHLFFFSVSLLWNLRMVHVQSCCSELRKANVFH